MIIWMRRHAHISRSLSLALMVVASAGLYRAAQTHVVPGIWLFLGLFILGNLLALFA
jgi:hypothetical protein